MDTTLQLADERIYEIPLDEIFLDDVFNCRGAIVPMDVADLAKSILKDGQQAPIIVQPWDKVLGKNYRVVSGHRRYSAIKKLGWATVKGIINTNITSEFHAKSLNIIENVKRKDLNLVQEARALETYTRMGWSQNDIAKELNMSQGWVQQRMNVLRLPEDIQLEVAAGYVNATQVAQLVQLTQEKQYEAVLKIKEARERGETKAILVKKPPNKPLARKVRKPDEIFEFQTIIRNVLGNSLVTRVMGWCAGEVSTFEVYRDIAQACKDEGIPFHIPQEVIDSFNS